MKKKIYTNEIEQLSNAKTIEFPKYTTQIINLVNSNAQGTRPKVVGQMSELIQECNCSTLKEWIEWYDNRYPNAIENATNKIYDKFLEMQEASSYIDKELIKEWVKDLVYTKTYCGLKFQSAIIAYLAKEMHTSWRLATIQEEARNIDGFIGDKPLQIKADTYKTEQRLNEVIDVPIVYYTKTSTGITIEYNPLDFE